MEKSRKNKENRGEDSEKSRNETPGTNPEDHVLFQAAREKRCIDLLRGTAASVFAASHFKDRLLISKTAETVTALTE